MLIQNVLDVLQNLIAKKNWWDLNWIDGKSVASSNGTPTPLELAEWWCDSTTITKYIVIYFFLSSFIVQYSLDEYNIAFLRFLYFTVIVYMRLTPYKLPPLTSLL